MANMDFFDGKSQRKHECFRGTPILGTPYLDTERSGPDQNSPSEYAGVARKSTNLSCFGPAQSGENPGTWKCRRHAGGLFLAL